MHASDEVNLKAQQMADGAKALYTYFQTLKTKVPRSRADALRKVSSTFPIPSFSFLPLPLHVLNLETHAVMPGSTASLSCTLVSFACDQLFPGGEQEITELEQELDNQVAALAPCLLGPFLYSCFKILLLC